MWIDGAASRMVSKGSGMTVLETLRECLALFAPGHALDNFNWGASCLRAQDIQELNELPGKIREAINKIEKGEGLCGV